MVSTDPIIAYTLRTIAITQHQWIAAANTVLEGDSVDDVDKARAENLQTLHHTLAQPPPKRLSKGTTWQQPYHDMSVTIHDTLTKHDLMTGKTLDERELAKYDIPYYAMNPEEN